MNLRVTFTRTQFSHVLHQVPGVGASLGQTLSWFVTKLLEVRLLLCLCQERTSSLPRCEAAHHVSNQGLATVVPLGATADNLLLKWELVLGKIKSPHTANEAHLNKSSTSLEQCQVFQQLGRS